MSCGLALCTVMVGLPQRLHNGEYRDTSRERDEACLPPLIGAHGWAVHRWGFPAVFYHMWKTSKSDRTIRGAVRGVLYHNRSWESGFLASARPWTTTQGNLRYNQSHLASLQPVALGKLCVGRACGPVQAQRVERHRIYFTRYSIQCYISCRKVVYPGGLGPLFTVASSQRATTPNLPGLGSLHRTVSNLLSHAQRRNRFTH